MIVSLVIAACISYRSHVARAGIDARVRPCALLVCVVCVLFLNCVSSRLQRLLGEEPCDRRDSVGKERSLCKLRPLHNSRADRCSGSSPAVETSSGQIKKESRPRNFDRQTGEWTLQLRSTTTICMQQPSLHKARLQCFCAAQYDTSTCKSAPSSLRDLMPPVLDLLSDLHSAL